MTVCENFTNFDGFLKLPTKYDLSTKSHNCSVIHDFCFFLKKMLGLYIPFVELDITLGLL